MRVKWKKEKGKIDVGKNIIFKNTFLNHFLQDRFYPDVEFYGWKNTGKRII